MVSFINNIKCFLFLVTICFAGGCNNLPLNLNQLSASVTTATDLGSSTLNNSSEASDSINGVVLGLNGSGLTINVDKGGDQPITLSTGGVFSLPKALFSNILQNKTHTVAIGKQPTNPIQVCTILGSSTSLTMENLNHLFISCQDVSSTAGGSAQGVLGSGLILELDSGSLTSLVSVTQDGTFVFPDKIEQGSDYKVTVSVQPSAPNQVCTISGDEGTITDDITDINVTCVTQKYQIGGTVSGLGGGSLVLQNNSGDNITVSADGSFVFPTLLDDESTYLVSIFSSSINADLVCTPNNNNDKLKGSDYLSVIIFCSQIAYKVGGKVVGTLPGSSIILQDNAGDDLTISSDGSFVFPAKVSSGAQYVVTVKSSPGLSCAVSQGNGVMASADISAVDVECSPLVTVSGVLQGLNFGGSIVVTNNSNDSLTLSANGPFTFAQGVSINGTYSVKVSQSGIYGCTVGAGVGSQPLVNVTNVAINCYPSYYFMGTPDGDAISLYKTDGTIPGTVPVADVLADTSNIVYLNGKIIFTSASSGSSASSVFSVSNGSLTLWSSDGTKAGTKNVTTALLATATDGAPIFQLYHNKVYFSATDGVNGYQLWSFDGVSASLVKIINTTGDSAPYSFIVFNDTLYFVATDGINGYELWASDGLVNGNTAMVADINTSGDSDPSYLTVMNGALYFSATDSNDDTELWISDGVPGGSTNLVVPGRRRSSSNVAGIIVMDGKLYFTQDDSNGNNEIWTSDGVVGGNTQKVTNINPADGSNPDYLTVLNHKILFAAYDGVSEQLWSTDGTTSGTTAVTAINTTQGFNPTPLARTAQSFSVINQKIVFEATDGVHFIKPWVSDGTSDGTFMLYDVDPGVDLQASNLVLPAMNNKLFFTLTNTQYGNEVWMTDGTTAGTGIVDDLFPGTGSGAVIGGRAKAVRMVL